MVLHKSNTEKQLKKQATAKTYTVQIASDKNFKKIVGTTTTTKLKYTLSNKKKLTSKKKYFVRLYANGGAKYDKNFSTLSGTKKNLVVK